MTDARRYTGSLASSANMTASTSAEVNPFSERAISYDRNGNITALTRYGQAAASAEDILAYTYSGNRIASIANTGTLGGGGSYSHDANGNVTHDGLAGLDLQYNLLNLTKRISSGGTTLADYHYLADGTKAAAERGDGTGVQYRGSLIYTKEADGGLELDCALTSGGRIANDAGTLQVQHFIRDHLGSVRTVVDGSTGDVLETSDYLPFGKRWELTGGQAAQTITDPTNRWRFSGKETQSFYNPAIPYNDFGARLHDPRTGRWLGVDPLVEKYYSLSAFGYCAGNPIRLVDSDGRKIYFAEGSTDSFKKKFHDTVRYMNSKGTAGNLAKLESSEIVYYIKETSSIKDVMFSIKNNNTIYWDPNHLAKTDSEMWLSPATMLDHEAEHAVVYDRYATGKMTNEEIIEYSKSKERGSDKDYGTIHERNVIEFREQSTARKHGEIDNSQVTRRNHKISMVKGDVANKTPQEIETIVRSNNELL